MRKKAGFVLTAAAVALMGSVCTFPSMATMADTGSPGAHPATNMPGNASAVPADNSGINQRDRNDQTITPEDQSQSKGDVKLAAKIRKAVNRQKGLSVDGHNIKIITQQNRVTLRGPVKDANELAMIEKIVKRSAGTASIDNQLEVK